MVRSLRLAMVDRRLSLRRTFLVEGEVVMLRLLQGHIMLVRTMVQQLLVVTLLLLLQVLLLHPVLLLLL